VPSSLPEAIEIEEEENIESQIKNIWENFLTMKKIIIIQGYYTSFANWHLYHLRQQKE
jgi:hypothetical protein